MIQDNEEKKKLEAEEKAIDAAKRRIYLQRTLLEQK
jgi:hypothetical protein